MQQLIVLRGPIGSGKTSIMHEVNQRLDTSSVIEVDTIKRMIGPNESTLWRRDIAMKTSLYLATCLLRTGRSVVTETHARWPEQTERFHKVASDLNDVTFHSFLVTAPLADCKKRANKRTVVGINYAIDDAMISAYHTNLEPMPNEHVVDTSLCSVIEAAKFIIEHLSGDSEGDSICVESLGI